MGDSSFSQAYRTGDPFIAGDLRADQMALGYPIAMGMHFPDLEGPVVLIRRKVYPGGVQNWYIAGTAHVDAGTIDNASGMSHSVSSGYEYAAARAFGNGFVSEFSEPVRIDLDGSGDIITPALPTWPRDVNAIAIAAGEFRVTWTYETWGQGGAPTDFRIYRGATIATIDYGTVLGTVTYDPQLLRQTFDTSGSYSDGTPHAFAVRARNSGGVAELNEFTTDVVLAEAGTPAAAVIASADVRSQGAA